MDRLTLMPFLQAMFIAVFGMPTNVYQVCYGEMGHEHGQPWRARTVEGIARVGRTLMSRLAAMCTGWRGHPLAMPALVVIILAVALALPTDSHGASLAIVAATPGLKQLRQDKADNEAAEKKLKAEGRQLLAAKERTPDQEARLTAIEAELDTLATQASAIATNISRAERFAADAADSGDPNIRLGRNRAELEPWGPELPESAPPIQRTEARHIALGNFAQAVRIAALGQGIADPRLQAAATGAGTQTDSNLGFAIPNEVAPGIERDMFETGAILSRVDARSITGNSITYNRFDQTSRADGSRQGGVLGYWVDEGTAPTASNTKLDRLELKLRKVGAFGVMTDELLSDAMALGGELETAFTEELTFQVENKVYRGNGASAPLGFMASSCLVSVAKETSQAAATIKGTNITKMRARWNGNPLNGAWLANIDCLEQLSDLAQPIGTGGVPYRYASVGDDGVIRLWGMPVLFLEYPETLGTQGDIALVDLKKYRLIRKGGIEQASSMHVYFAQGEQAFRAFYRVDGKPVPKAALTPFKGSGTLSPFVVLDTRA